MPREKLLRESNSLHEICGCSKQERWEYQNRKWWRQADEWVGVKIFNGKRGKFVAGGELLLYTCFEGYDGSVLKIRK